MLVKTQAYRGLLNKDGSLEANVQKTKASLFEG